MPRKKFGEGLKFPRVGLHAEGRNKDSALKAGDPWDEPWIAQVMEGRCDTNCEKKMAPFVGERPSAK